MTELKLEANVTISDMNFGDEASRRIKSYLGGRTGEDITNTKLRGILEMVNKIYSSASYSPGSRLSERHLGDIHYLKSKLAYEHKEDSVKRFIEHTGIMNPLEEIVKSGEKAKFLLYCRYMESLVAYSRYHLAMNRAESQQPRSGGNRNYGNQQGGRR